MLKIGDKMPDFQVIDQDGNTVSTADFIGNGRKTIIYFYPKDNTSGYRFAERKSSFAAAVSPVRKRKNA